MKVSATVKRKYAAAKKKAVKFLKDKKNRKKIAIAVVLAVAIYLYVKFGKKQTTETTTTTPTPGTGQKDTDAISNFPSRDTAVDGSKGVYYTKQAGREFHFNRTGEFEPSFDGGLITDVTPGLSFDGTNVRLGGQYVFYAIDYNPYKNDATIGRLQNLYLPDHPFTISQFVCNDKINTYQKFVDKFNGWNDGVNMKNARCSRVFVSIHSDVKQGNGLAPRWLKLSRHLLAPSAAAFKDMLPLGKNLCTGYINRGDSYALYKAIGAATYLDGPNSAPQENSWLCAKLENAAQFNENNLKSLGRHISERLGASKRSVNTDEFIENIQGVYQGSFNNLEAAYRDKKWYYQGAMDVYRERGITNAKESGNYGGYGEDDYFGLLDSSILFSGTRADYEKYLTTHVCNTYSQSQGFRGISEYYLSGQINDRNINHKVYFYNQLYQLPYQFLSVQNRVKLGTGSYQGQNRERRWQFFTSMYSESLVRDENNQIVGIEMNQTGEKIPFPGGTMLTRNNLQNPACWGEMFEACLWAQLLSYGPAVWCAPGSTLGIDTTKVDWYTDQSVFWIKDGGVQQNYVSGQNGAPQNSPDGLKHMLGAPPTDAAFAAEDALWQMRDRIQVLEHVAYASNRGGHNPTPGQAGLHLNGYGQLNWGLFVERDLVEQKKGIALKCSGSGGTMALYYNGYLQAHEYEDVTIMGKTVRAYGRQTVRILY